MSNPIAALVPAIRLLLPLVILVAGIIIGWSLRELSFAPVAHYAAGQPMQVTPMDGAGAGHHPTFHCADFRKPVDSQGAMSIEQLTAQDDGASISIRARIMNVYPNIMGTNWYHLCDKLNGQVLVAETRQIAHPGVDISISGTLRQNAQIGGAYTFPLFLENAAIKGAAAPSPLPSDSQTL